MSEVKPFRARKPVSLSEVPPLPEIAALAEPAVEAVLPPRAPTQPALGPDIFANVCQKTLASWGESQTALTQDVAALTLEMTGLARANLAAAGESMTALFAAKTVADAVEIQLGFARRSLDAMVDGSTKLSEFGLRLARGAAKSWAPFSV